MRLSDLPSDFMKKILSVFLSTVIIVLCVLSAPFCAYASQGEITIVENPHLTGDYEINFDKRLANNNEVERIAESVKKAMIMRNTLLEEYIDTVILSNEQFNAYLETVYYKALAVEESNSSVDGSYLKWNVKSFRAIYMYDNEEGRYRVVFEMGYYNNAKQEQEVSKAVNDYISSIDVDAYSDYELLKMFHDHILDICTYNRYNLYEDTNFSSYGVFGTGLAVCQGYALAFYRLCREVGIDCAIVTSDPKVGCHAWNLVWCGDAYYFVDCTWDDNYHDSMLEEYDDNYFLVDYQTLQADDTQYEHLIEDTYDNPYFNSKYRSNISQTCYDNTTENISNYALSELREGVDYTASSSSESSMVISGIGNHYGVVKRDKSVIPLTLSYVSGAGFTGEVITPEVTIDGLVRGVDFDVISFAVNAGEQSFAVIGLGKYSGMKYVPLHIYTAYINNFPITLSYTTTYYDGTIKKPSVSIKGLKENYDYIVTYNPVAEGTGYVYITGKGNCYGSVTMTYQVVKREINPDLVVLSNTSYEYNGYEKRPDVYISGLAKNQDYVVSYVDNVNPGTAYVIIRGIGCYGGEIAVPFSITKPVQSADSNTAVTKASAKSTAASKPAKAKLKKLITAKKAITVYWNKVSKASGYQIEYSTKSNFKGSKKITVSSSKATSKKISKLKKGKKYYVRVRAYKTVNGKKLYGSWSTKKSITCK